MHKVFYNKLVRDRIKEKIEEKGEACEIRTLTDDSEYEQELLKKVREEADELSRVRTRSDFLKEYADLMVVLDALTVHLEFSEALAENMEAKGGFQNRHFLQWSEDVHYESIETPPGIRNKEAS